MSNAVGSAFSTFAIASSVKPLAFSVVWLIAGRLVEVAVADGVSLDLGDLGFPNSRACAALPARRG